MQNSRSATALFSRSASHAVHYSLLATHNLILVCARYCFEANCSEANATEAEAEASLLCSLRLPLFFFLSSPRLLRISFVFSIILFTCIQSSRKASASSQTKHCIFLIFIPIAKLHRFALHSALSHQFTGLIKALRTLSFSFLRSEQQPPRLVSCPLLSSSQSTKW